MKTDSSVFETVLARINKMEEKQAEILANQKMLLDAQADNSDEESMAKEAAATGGVGAAGGGVSKEEFFQLKTKVEK